MLKNYNIKPFTKWVGGKRQIINELLNFMPLKYNKYIEPFVGGGALFFHISPKEAIINDLNSDLILSYIAIKNDIESLINLLNIHQKNNSKEYYMEIRNVDRNGKIKNYTNTEKAARFIYMLRVSFNGMYRVNSKNQFNVPYGRYKNPNIVNEELLIDINKYFNENKIDIYNKDFELVSNLAEKGDFIYFDPPYMPINQTSSFTSYTSEGFDFSEQIRLRDLFNRLTEKGVYCMLSNSYTNEIIDLYEGYNIHIVEANRSINSNGKKRGKIKEVIITNY